MNTEKVIEFSKSHYILAKPAYDENNKSYHIWLVNVFKYALGNPSETLLAISYDNNSFECAIQNYILSWSGLNPKRICEKTFEEMVSL